MHGDPEELYILARRTLLDTLELLGPNRDAVILVGAQAIYLHVGEADMAVAAMTKDADLALDTRRLMPVPNIEQALRAAGLESPPDQIGIWRNQHGGQVDFLVPEAFAGLRGRRAARLGAQGNTLARRARGLEGALVDNQAMAIASMDGDGRAYTIPVAGPGALLVAKLHKLMERRTQPHRLMPKDALDLLRLLRGTSTEQLTDGLRRQLDDSISATAASEAIQYLDSLFGRQDAPGSQWAAEAVQGLEDPSEIRASAAALASDLLIAIRGTG